MGIAKKLFILFFLFILIFYGTVFDLFFKVREMSATSGRIVGINNQVAALSKRMQDSLMDMDVNDKKFRLLKSEGYFKGFETARKAYLADLNQILDLEPDRPRETDLWTGLAQDHAGDTQYLTPGQLLSIRGAWGARAGVSQWMAAIDAARKENQARVEAALIRINTQSRQIVRNGIIGFGISILAGVFGVLFITRSMLTPLNRLKAGLTQVSNDNYAHMIPIRSRDEFGDLARAFNAMSRQLKADEEIRADFIATLSHEIRTPLSSIQESVNMVSEEVLGPVNQRQKKFLGIARAETGRIITLLNRLLDPANLDAPAREKTALDPNSLVRDAVQRLATQADLARVAMEFTPMDAAPRVLGDQDAVIQVLINILGNAVKFSEENGQVRITLARDHDHPGLMFQISDTGPGIPKDKQALVFKKYYRAKEVRDHADGVGLGLSIAKRIVLAHKGVIFVNNNPDRGCTFSFTLPCLEKG